MLKTYFFFYKALLFYYISFPLDTASLMLRNGRKGEVEENGESGENRNSDENLPQFWRIFKLDGKKGLLGEWRFKKKW